MLINYWCCSFCDYEEFWDGEEEGRRYGCSNENNEEGSCPLNNKYAGLRENCEFLDKEERND